MKLEAEISPRTDGTLIATAGTGNAYTFRADADGRLVCDVPDQDDVAFLLDTGNFHPADEQDIEIAVQVAGAPTGGKKKQRK